MNLHEQTELDALIKADEALEGAQQFNRGDCKLKTIRELIAERIKELENQQPVKEHE